MPLPRFCLAAALAALFSLSAPATEFRVASRQLTRGPKHHFFGYIGHVQNIPWNQSGRYIVALQTDFQDHMPRPDDAAEVILIDTQNNDAITVVDHSRGWNPQQGTMLYWNPQAPETQFFFNDRDPKTQEVFCVLFDIKANKRVTEYRFKDTPIGNSGVAQKGGWFYAINYARMARLRPVTGYPGAQDWTIGIEKPENDGVFKVDIATKEKKLLISFKQMADALRATHPQVDGKELFINHTLGNRENDLVYFFVRGDFDKKATQCNVACVMNADGTNFRPLKTFIGGHPEWHTGHRMIGQVGDKQIIYDLDRQEIAGQIGAPQIIPKPGGDIALSPDGKWFVNGYGDKGKNYYSIIRLSDGAWVRSAGFDQGSYIGGDLRIDPGPLWNRENNQLLTPGLADDAGKTRQLFILTIKPTR